MSAPAYLAITGGIGGAKLSLGLSKLLDADELALIVNTGDDFWHRSRKKAICSGVAPGI